jgi:hypothetical protein
MQAPHPLGLLILLVLSLWAAARDSSYKRAGGLKPDRFAKIALLVAIGISISCLAVLYVWSPGAAGTLTAVLSVVIFGLWELDRWRIRRKNPIGQIPHRSETEEHLRRVESAVQAARAIISEHDYSDDLRTLIVMGLIDQTREHHDSLLLLIRSGFVGSAFALARGIFDNLYRGLWFNCCATDTEIQQFEKDDKLPPGLKMPQMAKAIDAKYQAGDFYQNFMKTFWSPLCSYAHTGMLQLGHRFNEDKVAGVYSDVQILAATTIATNCYLMLAGRFLAAQNHAEKSNAVEALKHTYGPLLARKAANTGQQGNPASA